MRDDRRAGAASGDGLVVLSNRGPYALPNSDQAAPERTVGGLVAAVEPILERMGGAWISWLGRTAPEAGAHPPDPDIPPGHSYTLHEVLLTEAELRYYYRGFANDCLWPLAHSFLEKCRFEPRGWEAYSRVNQRFAERASAFLGTGRVVWVHDFHLALVPALLRNQSPRSRIAFFWHVPFPPLEVMETLPWARELLAGLLGSDQIDFHIPAYAGNFLRCVRAMLSAHVDLSEGRILWQGRKVKVQALPLGIDYATFQETALQPTVQRRADALRANLGNPVLLLGIDRLDYTKGIPERLEAFEALLDSWPEARGRLVMLQVAVPSRERVAAYRDLRRRVEELVGRINGRFGDETYQPVVYRWRAFSRTEVISHYLAADVALVTPLRDGLNLVAKEFVASRQDGRGVLVLSKFCGAARSLQEALMVNPYHLEGLMAGIREAVEMEPAEQARRLRLMQVRVAERDLTWWWQRVQASLVELATPVAQAVGDA